MKSFNDWFLQGSKPCPRPSPSSPPITIDDDLLEYNDWNLTNFKDWVYPCRSCGEDSPIYCEPIEWDYMMHYCGRSPHCCP